MSHDQFEGLCLSFFISSSLYSEESLDFEVIVVIDVFKQISCVSIRNVSPQTVNKYGQLRVIVVWDSYLEVFLSEFRENIWFRQFEAVIVVKQTDISMVAGQLNFSDGDRANGLD